MKLFDAAVVAPVQGNHLEECNNILFMPRLSPVVGDASPLPYHLKAYLWTLA